MVVEGKYGKHPARLEEAPGNKHDEGDFDNYTDSSTNTEEEDDEGILASGALDKQFHATLEAIRTRDPRVYDEKAIFYAELGDQVHCIEGQKEKHQPMYLRDYHRRNLLEGLNRGKGEDNGTMTYAQQQDHLKTDLVKDIHAVAGEIEGDGDNDFFVPRMSVPEVSKQGGRDSPATIEVDIKTAEKDPETFLSNFISARAWVPAENSNFQPFESDDEEDDRRAELFEEAYNLRFEDPKGSNEKLLSHARDAAAKYSVRRETTNPRKKARDAERARKDAVKQKRKEEKVRLRKLRVADAEEKVRKIKKAAGLRGTALQESDWATFIEEGWDDARWEQEMKKRFGEDYYADKDLSSSDEDEARASRRKIKKPRWEDDIDIKDLVPDFKAEDETQAPPFTLIDNESDYGDTDQLVATNGHVKPKKATKANRKQDRDDRKREARKERQKIEQLVDEELNANQTISGPSAKHAGHFRYRATSPLAYGLTAHDILMASDSQLNQYAGLKKMATFRDAEKKRRDKKRLGKKARLREWRKETFGSEHGPQTTLGELLAGKNTMSRDPMPNGGSEAIIKEGKKSKTRSRKSKNKGVNSPSVPYLKKS